MNFQQRIQYAKDKLGFWKDDGTFANCLGTALYLRGVVSKLEWFNITDEDKLSRLLYPETLNEPTIYSIALFRTYWGQIEHAGVITNLKPIQMVHLWSCWEVQENYNIQNFLEKENPRDTVEYRLPKRNRRNFYAEF